MVANRQQTSLSGTSMQAPRRACLLRFHHPAAIKIRNDAILNHLA